MRLYHGTPSHNLKSIQEKGLDPDQAMSIGGATFTAAAQTGRTPTETDKKAGLWFGDEETARDYAHNHSADWVVLRVDAPDELFAPQGENYTCAHKISTDRIWFEKKDGTYAPIEDWQKGMEKLRNQWNEGGSDSESDSE